MSGPVSGPDLVRTFNTAFNSHKIFRPTPAVHVVISAGPGCPVADHPGEVMPQPQPPRTLAVRNVADCEALPMRSQTYEITFAGRAGATVCAAFEDCRVTPGPGTTTLHA
jgi:hypothetical protein